MNRAPSEDLHNTLLASQDLPFFEEIQEKASRDLAFLEKFIRKFLMIRQERVMMTLKVSYLD